MCGNRSTGLFALTFQLKFHLVTKGLIAVLDLEIHRCRIRRIVSHAELLLNGITPLVVLAAQIVFCKSSGGQAEGEMDGFMLR